MTARPKALLAEDDPFGSDIMIRMLEMAGYEVIHGDTVEKVLALIRENTDIALAVVDGCLWNGTVCNTEPIVHELRKRGVSRIYGVSGNPDTNELLRQAGCLDTMEKPFQLKQFLALVRIGIEAPRV